MLTEDEKLLLKKFKKMRIPSMYKDDPTVNILYVEHVDFDLCTMLLKGKKAKREDVQNEIKKFAIFLSDFAEYDVLNFDFNQYDRDYLNMLIEVVNIYIKYNL